MSKPKVMTTFKKLPVEIQEQIKLAYPRGFEKFLIRFKNHKNKFISALPYETDDRDYMVKMSVEEAQRIILNDDDYNDSGHLKEKIKDSFEAKYDDSDDEDEDDLDIDEIEIDEPVED